MWFPLKEVANFAMLMGALVLIFAISEAANWLVHITIDYFRKEK